MHSLWLYIEFFFYLALTKPLNSELIILAQHRFPTQQHSSFVIKKSSNKIGHTHLLGNYLFIYQCPVTHIYGSLDYIWGILILIAFPGQFEPSPGGHRGLASYFMTLCCATSEGCLSYSDALLHPSTHLKPSNKYIWMHITHPPNRLELDEWDYRTPSSTKCLVIDKSAVKSECL